MLGVVLLLAGLIVIVVGFALWYWPLAFIVAGLELCFVSTLYSRGGVTE